jgi:membrane protease YdiL (CAAX protease family)
VPLAAPGRQIAPISLTFVTGSETETGREDAATRTRVLRQEVVLILVLSIAASAVYAVLSFLASATADEPLRAQSTVLASSRAPGRPWIDLGYQLARIVLALGPVALAWHFLVRGGESLRSIGADVSQPGRDLLRATILAAVVGGTGLALYVAAYGAGVNLAVVPSALPDVWWRIPILVLLSVQNALLEEVLLAGFVLHRLQQLGWSPWRAVAVSALLRGSYHLYQGIGGFLGNVAMGVLFARLYQRWGRCMPLVVAHALIDIVAFVGWTFLVGRVGWLPTPQ